MLVCKGHAAAKLCRELGMPVLCSEVGRAVTVVIAREAEHDSFLHEYLGAYRRRMPTVCVRVKVPNDVTRPMMAPQDPGPVGDSPSACAETL